MSKFKDNWKLINKGIEHTWLCPCGERNREGEVCPECGKKQPTEKALSNNAYIDAPKDSKLCPKCGGKGGRCRTCEGTGFVDKETKKAVNISDAGGVPNSLLARQDLETSKTQGIDWAEAYKVAIDMARTGMSSGDIVSKIISKYSADYKTAEELVKLALEYLKKKYSKSSIEQTGKQLDKVADKAEEAETTKEKNQLIGKMKEIQLKRQKAVIDAREPETSKSFKDFWKKNER